MIVRFGLSVYPDHHFMVKDYRSNDPICIAVKDGRAVFGQGIAIVVGPWMAWILFPAYERAI